MNQRLNIIAVDEKTASPTPSPKRTRRQEMQATFEKKWLEDPEQFDPMQNAMERKRLQRSSDLLVEHIALAGKRVVDLGCGNGIFAKRLADKGAEVDAVDVSSLALQKVPAGVRAIQDCMPATLLPDNHYDLAISLDLVAHLPAADHRLFMAELSRLVKREGLVLCSTALDCRTEDPLGAFFELAETEFEILAFRTSSHALFLSLLSLLEAPSRLFKFSQMQNDRKRELGLWFQFNAAPPLSYLWRGLSPIGNFFSSLLKKSTLAVYVLEKMTLFLRNRTGVTHVVYLAKKRDLKFI